jgi:hypothetical protein
LIDDDRLVNVTVLPRRRFRGYVGGRQQAQCLGMTNFTELPSVPSDHLVPFTDQLRLAVAAYLARFKGSSRYHTASDLRCYLAWCAERVSAVAATTYVAPPVLQGLRFPWNSSSRTLPATTRALSRRAGLCV